MTENKERRRASHRRRRDSALLREGIVLLLRNAGHDVVGQTDNGDDLLLKVRSYTPDVVVVDVRMPPTHTDEGLRAAREIRERHPGTGVLVLSSHLEPAYAAELVADDASGVGYLPATACPRRGRVLCRRSSVSRAAAPPSTRRSSRRPGRPGPETRAGSTT
jgi:DNA-binding NarL/FixJ family response regulator